jgi:hypothetical protein
MKIITSLFLFLLLLCYGCAQKESNPASSQSQSAESIVAVSIAQDYSEGNIGMYSISDSTSYPNLLPGIYTDNDIRTYGSSTYILERYGKDNIIKISGSVIADSTVVYDKNIGASVNIQDIAFISSNKAYITQYVGSQVIIFNPSTGEKTGVSIDLSAYVAYAGTDSAVSTPYCSRALYYNGKVYIACQRLKAPEGGYIQAADNSLIVIVNAVSDTVEKTVRLAYKNPQELSVCNGKLYVAGVGIWGANDGGIECIDLSVDTNAGTIADEASLGGDVESIIVVSDTKGYAIISTPTYTTEAYSFNPQAKTKGSIISGVDSPCANHIAFDGKYVYIGDRSLTSPGIVVIDPATDLKVGDTKYVGLPPNSLAFLKIE